MSSQSKIENFTKRIEKLNESLEIVKKFGFDEDLLVSHLIVKLKISGKKAKQIINTFDDFFRKTINNAIVDELEE